MPDKPIDLDYVRLNLAAVKNYRRLDPILKAVEDAPENEKKERLFSAACRLREMIDEGLTTRRHAWLVLRTAARRMWSLYDTAYQALPDDEIDRTISAGLFKGRPR
jgi:hypothetical protein